MPPASSSSSLNVACASAIAVADEMRAVLGPAGELARALAAEAAVYRPDSRRLTELSQTLAIANALLSQVQSCRDEPQEKHAAYSVDAVAREVLPMLRACVGDKAKVTLTEDSHSPLLHGSPVALKRALLHVVRSLAAAITTTRGVIDVGVALIGFTDSDSSAGQATFPLMRRMVRLTVADNGVGMDPARIQAVAQSSSDVGPPLRWEDVGLKIASGIIKDHGGQLDIESHVGLGTMVRIDLPVVWPGRALSTPKSADATDHGSDLS